MEDGTLEDFVDVDWKGQMLLQSLLYGIKFVHRITAHAEGWEMNLNSQQRKYSNQSEVRDVPRIQT